MSSQSVRQHEFIQCRIQSHFFKEETKFFGYILTVKGIQPDPEKVEEITNFPEPRNVKQLRGSLGLVNFYSKFSSKHAEETVPLLHQIKKATPWKWDEDMQSCFKRVKQHFSNTVTLYFPDPKKPYYLETDASNYALGAILYQKNDKQSCGLCRSSEHTYRELISKIERTTRHWHSFGHVNLWTHAWHAGY